MNIYDLRKIISVTVYVMYSDGAIIRYLKNDKLHVISLTLPELMEELTSIGSLDENGTLAEYNNYELSQWDAINIAIRHELEKETEIELNDSDLFSAIAKITKPNK